MLSALSLFFASLFVQPADLSSEEIPQMKVMNGGGGVIVKDKKKEN
ncbi:hypothetical protein [Pseudoalteromonas spongiae]|nr:hypothetical protein [Pseudoalteromonas spongiae]